LLLLGFELSPPLVVREVPLSWRFWKVEEEGSSKSASPVVPLRFVLASGKKLGM
jgi:hypothetical protein